MSTRPPALGDPDDAGSGEPYDTGKDEAVFDKLDKGELGGTIPPADDAGGKGGDDKGKDKEKEDDISSVDDMLSGERGKDDGDLDEDEDLDDEDKDEGKEGEGDEGKDKGKEKEDIEESPEPTEDDHLTARPAYSKLKKEFPDLFKKYPELRQILFREPEYSKLFPTVREAKEAADYVDVVRQQEQFIMQGDSEVLLKSIFDSSPAVLAKFVEGLPAALHGVSQEAYVKMTTPILRNALILARQHAKNVTDKDLWHGLDHIEKFLFGDPRYSLKRETPKEDPLKEERAKLDQERNEIYQKEARGFEGRVKDRSQGMLKKEILRGLDPQNTLTPRMRTMLAEQALDEITGRMAKDNAHLSAMNSLWKRAAKQGLSRESEEQLIRAWLSRARPLVGPVRRKLLSETIGRGDDKSKERENLPPRVPAGRERGTARAPLSGVRPSQVDYGKTSDDDIFEGKVTLRK